MNKKALRQFLIEANKAGYAGGDDKKWIKDPDGSTTIIFEKSLWKYHDNFFGGEPYGGREVVSYEGKSCWMMVYYGWVLEGVETDPVYGILRKALMKMPEDAPFRGPKEFKEGDLVYSNSWQGELERFSGQEQITQRGKLIYQASYMGGLVDQRVGV